MNLKTMGRRILSGRPASDLEPIGIVALGACVGIWTGWLEASARNAVQLLNWMSFEARLTTSSATLFWAAPLVYAPLFAMLALAVAWMAGWVPGLDRTRAVVFALGILLFRAPLASGGYTSGMSTIVLSVGLAAVLQLVLTRDGAIALRRSRRRFLWTAVAGLAVFAVVEGGTILGRDGRLRALQDPDPAAPNVVLIVIDTLRADHVGSYGYSRDTTPEIDRLAAGGVQFERAIAASSWTLPSHVTLLTGYLPGKTGAGFHSPYDDRFPTLGAALEERGYRTGAISANTLLFNRANGFGAGFNEFDDSFYSTRDIVLRTYYGQKLYKFVLRDLFFHGDIPGRRTAENVTRSALSWIDSGGPRPFFLMLNYFDVHDPRLPPAPWDDTFAPAGPTLNAYVGSECQPLSDQELEVELSAYDSALAYADHWIGELVRGIDESGISENTAIVVTSDHGESLGQHGLLLHASSLYFEQIHVPLIVYFPGRVPAGRKVQTPVSHSSLPATILELAGGGGSINFPPKSLSALWNTEAQLSWPSPVSELEHRPFADCTDFPAYHGSLESIIDGDVQLIQHSQFGAALFALDDDSKEENDLSGQAGMQPILDDLAGQLKKAIGEE